MQTPSWRIVESAGQSDTSAWESCFLEVLALMWTPSLCSQVWVEGRVQRDKESKRRRVGFRGREDRERGRWVWNRTRKLPTCQWGFSWKDISVFVCVCNSNYSLSGEMCLIILHNVHLKQYLYMSVQFNIWVTSSSQLQNTPQHGSSGQPIMQRVTNMAGRHSTR